MLVKTIDEVRAVANVPLALELDSLKSDIEEAEIKYLIPVLGKALYEALEASYQADELEAAEKAHLKNVLPYAQRIIVNLAIAEAIDFLQVQITDTGVQRIEKSDEKSAYHYQKLDAQDYYVRKGFNGVERCLLFLEENAGDYASWKSSPAYTRHKEMFIADAISFNEYHQIDESRRTYVALRPIMKRVEDFKIRHTIGEALFAELKAQLVATDNSLTADNKALIENYIRPAVAHLTISEACQELAMKVTPVGVLISDQLAVAPRTEEKKQANDNKLAQLATRANGTGEQYLKNLSTFLIAEASAVKYAAFYASDLYPKSEPHTDKPKAKIYGAL